MPWVEVMFSSLISVANKFKFHYLVFLIGALFIIIDYQRIAETGQINFVSATGFILLIFAIVFYLYARK